MGLKAIGAVLLASAVAFTAIGAAAQTMKRKPARVVVTKRSYLDAGKEVKPGERHFTDYVFPPNYSPYSVVDPTRSYRYPLPDPFWAPGCCASGYQTPASDRISATIASPIWAVPTTVVLSDLMSAVRSPLARAAAIAWSIRSASFSSANE
jgi:hypothetical protein